MTYRLISWIPALALGLLLTSTHLANAANEPKGILLWPNGAPGSETRKTEPEAVEVSKSGEEKIWNIHQPALLPYLPPKQAQPSAAILVIPGGGHRNLAITHEGYNVAHWLTNRGIAAFVLKYRLARETNSTYKIEEHALADTHRALQLIRSRAAEWNLDPKKVGALGFSAGGELVALSWMKPNVFSKESSQSTESNRPDFQVLIYPGRSGDIIPNTNAPPAFLACAYNDRKDISEGLAEVYLRFKRANVPAELHIYAHGGHGFGVRPNEKKPLGNWTERMLEWMGESHFPLNSKNAIAAPHLHSLSKDSHEVAGSPLPFTLF
jgi:endo-1,4-beta-xylanase